MSATPMAVQTRPFAIEPVTNVMLPDGIFDNALYKLRIACHYTNTSGTDLTNVTIYLESVGDPGIVVTGQTYTFPKIAAGASVLVSWAADFQNAQPGKPLVSFVARADGYTSARSIQQIFVSQTRYDSTTDTYSCTIPEGRLDITRVRVVPPAKDGWWWPGDKPGDKERPPWQGPYVPTAITMTWFPNPAYAGTHGDLPFQDPWWKVIALIVLIVAAIVGIIAAALGSGTFNVGVKGKFEETDPGVVTSCCSPAPGGGVSAGPTVAGVCGVIASVALAVALSDDADPHWRGQIATPPAPGELTTSETVKAEWTLLDEPRAGQPYRTQVKWSYDRYTTGGTYHHEVDEVQTNIHVTEEVRVTTPATVSLNGGDLWVQASFIRPDGSSFTGPDLYAFALFRSPGGYYFLANLGDDGIGYDAKPNDGVYSGGLSLEKLAPVLKELGESGLGVWKVYVFGQDVNRVAPGTPPEIAAQTIGGFVVGSAVQITFDPNLPCPLEAQGSIKVV
jgi:hypothetical protein